MKFVSMFAGIGGIELGLERAGHECVGQVENEPYCIKVLEKHWPDIWRHDDITTLKPEEIPEADLWTGGFPCQPFSSASHGRRVASDLWPEMFRLIKESRPMWVVAENVTEKAVRKAKRDVQSIGYEAGYRRIGAWEVGADHQRNRWWLFAHANNESELYRVLNAKVALLPEICKSVWGWTSFANRCRMADGISNRVDRLDIDEGYMLVLTYANKTISNPREILQALRSEAYPSTLQKWKTRSTNVVSSPQVLQLYLRQLQERCQQEFTSQEGEKISEKCLRILRDYEKPSSPSYRSRLSEQYAEEYPNSLQALSRLLAQSCHKAWTPYRGMYATDRVNRLKCLGNAVVPAVAQYIGELLQNQERPLF